MIQSESDFLRIAFKHYDNPSIKSEAEFVADLKRFNYLNAILQRYYQDFDEYKLRLAVNHIVILRNLFSNKTVELIIWKIKPEILESVMTILYFLNMIEVNDRIDFALLNKLETI